MKLLEMNHIKKSFNGVQVIQDISLSVETGEILAIIGPSGSGKSTLLRCATMLETIDGGEIYYLGKTRLPGWKTESLYFQGKKNKRRSKSILGWYFRILIYFRIFLYSKILPMRRSKCRSAAKKMYMKKQGNY